MIIYKCWLNTGKGNILSLEPNRARQISLCLALRNTNTNFWSHIMPKNDEISEPPGLKDITNLFPPSAPASPSLVANVSMKLPAFWPDAAEVWFAQADTQFEIQNVSVSKTKFYQAVGVLPQEVVSQILDLICTPPAGDPYEVLREHLITLYTWNDYQRFEALVSLPLSDDQKPSHLMNRMLALLQTRLHPLTKSSQISSSLVNLLSEILDESLQVNHVSSRACPPKTALSRRSPTPAPTSRSSTQPGVCWFHKKHGNKAVNCRKPCCSMLEN